MFNEEFVAGTETWLERRMQMEQGDDRGWAR
jgi:hypothetical protein